MCLGSAMFGLIVKVCWVCPIKRKPNLQRKSAMKLFIVRPGHNYEPHLKLVLTSPS